MSEALEALICAAVAVALVVGLRAFVRVFEDRAHASLQLRARRILKPLSRARKARLRALAQELENEIKK